MAYPGVLERYGGYESKEQCESLGGKWVKGYHRKDGKLVHAFCREPQHRKR
jgi:hypothetical protein